MDTTREPDTGRPGAGGRRRVLLLAYHFPPIGGVGVHRAVQLVQGLPGLGWDPVVVTGPGRSDDRWRPVAGGADEAGGVPIHRAAAPEPPRETGWWGRAERWLGATPPWARWWTEHVLGAAAAAGEVDVVHAIVAPYASADGARAVASALGRPLVVDLEDPWALDEMLVYATGLHRRLALARMGRLVGAADAVVMNTREGARRVAARFPAAAPGVTSIPNAFRPADFAAPAPTRDDGRFRIVHTGSLHTELGLRHRDRAAVRRALGGAVAGVDFLTRSLVVLLEALGALPAELAGRVELHVAGVLTGADRASLGSFPVVDHGFLEHGRTIELIRSADLLFLPMQDLPAGARATIVPHKTYEYVASGRPILAAVPDGDARDLLAAVPAARLCRPADAAAMTRVLVDELGRGEVPPPYAGLDELGSARLAADVAALYGRVAAVRR